MDLSHDIPRPEIHGAAKNPLQKHSYDARLHLGVPGYIFGIQWDIHKYIYIYIYAYIYIIIYYIYLFI